MKLDNKLIKLKDNVKCKQFYNELTKIKGKNATNSAQLKWEEHYYFYNLEW